VPSADLIESEQKWFMSTLQCRHNNITFSHANTELWNSPKLGSW